MKSNQRKRQPSSHSSSDEPEAKRTAAMIEPLKLDDLNDDVLEEIFSYLDVNDLLNVVNSDEVFLDSTRRAFKRSYRNTCIRVPYFIRVEHHATRQRFSKSTELLRYFGGSMSSLEVSFDDDSSIDQRLLGHIVTFCSETITELKILHPTDRLKFNKSFPTVRKLTFSYGRLNFTLNHLVEWFPSLENLTFDCIEDAGRLLKSGQKITSLKSLSLNATDEYSVGCYYRFRDLHSFIAVNTQVNEICLTLNDNIKTFDELAHSPDEIVPDELLTVKLNIGQNYFELNSLAQLKIPTDRIAHLELHFDQITDQIWAYLARCVNIKTLKIGSTVFHDPWNEPFGVSSRIDLKKFIFLTQLEISLPVFRFDVAYCYNIVRGTIEPFLKQVKSLITMVVRFKYYTRPELLNDHFKVIRSCVNLEIWSFTPMISSKEILFTLAKNTA